MSFPGNPYQRPCGCMSNQPCTCQPCPPPCPPPQSSLTRCWAEIQAFKDLVAAIIGEIGGPIKTGPIQGVVDGSQAMPGMVGEVASAAIVGQYTAAALQAQTVNTLILQPGDWDVQASCEFSAGINGAFYQLSVVPSGVSGPMLASLNADVAAPVSGGPAPVLNMNSIMTQANITVPTLLAFNLTTNTAAAGTAGGNFTLRVRARRMR
jgi:hypothetical protein